MTSPTTITAGATEARELLESDAAYFELAAHCEQLEAATLSFLPDFGALPAACVVQRVEPRRIRSKPSDWVAAVEREVEKRGFRIARIYLTPRPAPAGRELEAALSRAGFKPRIEYGFLFRHELSPSREIVTLREVCSETDWQTKEKLHCEAELGSDGYRSDGALWTKFVRAKCASGGKRSFLIEVDGEVCGSVGMMEFPTVIRAKNLFVSPGRQRQGLGSSAMRIVARLAAARGRRAGIFGVQGEPGESTYRRLGMEVVTEQTEWSKQL